MMRAMVPVSVVMGLGAVMSVPLLVFLGPLGVLGYALLLVGIYDFVARRVERGEAEPLVGALVMANGCFWQMAGALEVWPLMAMVVLLLMMALGRGRLSEIGFWAVGLMSVVVGMMHPVLTAVPLMAGLGLVAVWGWRGLALMVMAGAAAAAHVMLHVEMLPGLVQGSAEMRLVWALVAASWVYQIYHWRWWSAPAQMAWGLGGWSLAWLYGSGMPLADAALRALMLVYPCVVLLMVREGRRAVVQQVKA